MQKTTKNAIILFQHECNYIIICTIAIKKQIILIKYVSFTFSVSWNVLTIFIFQHSKDK